jgi:hypothetical protein
LTTIFISSYFEHRLGDSTMEIDHVVLVARSRADAERALSEAGLGVARGRTIPGLGLSNLVVPIGRSQLLEIHYPNDEAPAPGAPPLLQFDREALDAHPEADFVPMAWLVVIEEDSRLRELAAVNDMSVMEAPAEGPGFPPYTLGGFGENFVHRWRPCLIHWPEGAPPLTAPHRRQPAGITRIDVAGPEDEIRRWCGGELRGLRVTSGTAGPQRVEVGFVDGTATTFGLSAH